jgi:hypothetical protein
VIVISDYKKGSQDRLSVICCFFGIFDVTVIQPSDSEDLFSFDSTCLTVLNSVDSSITDYFIDNNNFWRNFL